MLERYFIEYCSPTLASVKFANLFRVQYESETDLDAELEQWSVLFAPKGISLHIFRREGGHALVYLYRTRNLQERLDSPQIRSFLDRFGYTEFETDAALALLDQRFQSRSVEAFPHEIGIFLDYPLEDVIGFIENHGKNYLCAGCWKVYANPWQAQRQFQKCRRCRELYRNLWQKGKSVMQLTVAA